MAKNFKENLNQCALTRREAISYVGKLAGGAAVLSALSSLGFASESPYRAPIKLKGSARKGTKVLILGAGIAGMVSAYELRKIGYDVKILEYRHKAGGRVWTFRGGDSYTELGGATQTCQFDEGNYLNPGPWRIPYHHYGILDYCKELKVPLQVFAMGSFSTYLYNSKSFGGKPQLFREVHADLKGHISELVAKAAIGGELDKTLSKEDAKKLAEGLRAWAGLSKEFKYVASEESSELRGFKVPHGGGLMPLAEHSTPIPLKDLVNSGFLSDLNTYEQMEYQSTMFQPIGGMDAIPRAFSKSLAGVITYNRKVTKIAQSSKGVSVTYTNLEDNSVGEESADYLICTIPLSILSQIEIQVNPKMLEAISSLPYGASFKAGIQFKRRFWEEDNRTFGGVTYTDLPIGTISYPSGGMNMGGTGVLQAAYVFGGEAYKFTALDPKVRLAQVLDHGAKVHPQMKEEFQHGVSVAWHKVPWSNGCYAEWTPKKRRTYYNDLAAIDNRIVLAGEHLSYIPAWQEGSVLSALDAITRLHERMSK